MEIVMLGDTSRGDTNMVKTVYLPKAEMERLSAAITKPTNTPIVFLGAKKDPEENAAELIQIVVWDGKVAHYRPYQSESETFDEVQVGVYKSLADNSILIQYESDYNSLVIKELRGVILYKTEE